MALSLRVCSHVPRSGPTSHVEVGGGRVAHALRVGGHTLVLSLVGLLAVLDLQRSCGTKVGWMEMFSQLLPTTSPFLSSSPELRQEPRILKGRSRLFPPPLPFKSLLKSLELFKAAFAKLSLTLKSPFCCRTALYQLWWILS